MTDTRDDNLSVAVWCAHTGGRSLDRSERVDSVDGPTALRLGQQKINVH